MEKTPRPDQRGRIDAHLPLDRRQALIKGQPLPERTVGSALFADLSGFTPLMERLADSLGSQQGAEELTSILNRLFTPLISQVHHYGGSIVAFGGDALTCWFPGELDHAAPRAAAAALAMQQHIVGSGEIETPAGAVTLSMHIGIASGPVRRFEVGGHPYGQLDVLAGTTLDRMAEAQHHASSGQVALDVQTAAWLPREAVRPLKEGFVLLQDFPLLETGAAVGGDLPELPQDQVRQWLTGPLYRRLQAGEGAFAAELRLVTSMFVQFIGLDYDDDPHVGTKLQRYVTLAQEKLAPYEGHLGMVATGDKGSLLLIFFGAPISHEDDPERALKYAIELKQAVRRLPFIQGQRIGISLGRVYAGILGSPSRCTYTVLGDEVNLSARLMQAAEVDQILVSQWVQQATEAQYTYRPLGTIQVKGKDKPVPLFEPLAARERPVGEAKEEIVGREEERALLANLLDRVAAGQGHVLQVVGEAGVGKSALLRHLLRQARERGWGTHVGACLSYGQNTPYLPWQSVVEQIAGLTPEMGPEVRIDGLKEAVRSLPDPPSRPGYWWARFPLLAEVMGLAVPDTLLTRALEGELRRDNTFQLLEALVRRLAAERPALVVLEDAYWGDELSLSLAAHLGRGLSTLPMLLMLIHRPFLGAVPFPVQSLEALPDERQTSLELTSLPEDSALALAQQRLEGAALPEPLVDLLKERARGNPFYIEELLRALQEAAHLRRIDGPEGHLTVELAGDWDSLHLPDTIEGIVRARMDRLPEGQRLTLKVSSVIGRSFQRPLLQQVHPARLPQRTLVQQLDRLDQAEFTQLEEPEPEWRYIFYHPILHEVTYETLLFAQRRQLHGAIGTVLEGWHREDLARIIDLLAYHFARSEDREKAIHYLHRAGDKARREFANEVAIHYYSQALERLLPGEREQRYNLLAGRERIYDLLGDRGAQEKDLEEMGRLAQKLEDAEKQVAVLNRSARRAADIGAFSEARRLAQQAWQDAQLDENWAGAAEAQRTLGIIHGSLGEYEDALQVFFESHNLYRRSGDRSGETSCLMNLGTVYLYTGNTEQARAYYSRALEIAHSEEHRLHETQALINLGLTELKQRDYEPALGFLQQALTISRETGSLFDEEVALSSVAESELSLGRLDEAYEHNSQALRLARTLEDREGEAVSLTNFGLLSAYRGELEQARQLLLQAMEKHQAIGYRRGEASVLHYLGLVALWGEKAELAKESLQRALTLRQEIGEEGNAQVTRAWLAAAHQAEKESQLAQQHIQKVLEQIGVQGYGGDDPEQEVWWAAYQVWQASGENDQAQHALERAYQLVQEQAGRIQDASLRRSFLEQVPVIREIAKAYEASL
jgi:predicted ATPase/class 3 adenylate cyclase